jgi:hypothetical protein
MPSIPTPAAFQDSLAGAAPPPDLPLAVQALWWIGKGDWNRAHDCVQQAEGQPDCDLIHAHLHRVEGDAGNAAYWYRRAGRPVGHGPADQEYQSLVRAMLART